MDISLTTSQYQATVCMYGVRMYCGFTLQARDRNTIIWKLTACLSFPTVLTALDNLFGQPGLCCKSTFRSLATRDRPENFSKKSALSRQAVTVKINTYIKNYIGC